MEQQPTGQITQENNSFNSDNEPQGFKKFSQYFGGKYAKYWYIVAGLLLLKIGVGFFINLNKDSYDIIVYNSQGQEVKTIENVKKEDIMQLENNPAVLPPSKAIVLK